VLQSGIHGFEILQAGFPTIRVSGMTFCEAMKVGQAGSISDIALGIAADVAPPPQKKFSCIQRLNRIRKIRNIDIKKING
jgi:hypothetical protein